MMGNGGGASPPTALAADVGKGSPVLSKRVAEQPRAAPSKQRPGLDRRSVVLAAAMLVALWFTAALADEFRTSDPLKTFVEGSYARGDDYFIGPGGDSILLRCELSSAEAGIEGIALSESSIWGNRTGPWEIFRTGSDGSFSYVETRHLPDTSCLESCRLTDYLTTGRCEWQRGWPRN